MYSILETGKLELITKAPSFGTHDGPRHVLPSPDGQFLYVVTEHSERFLFSINF